MHQNSEPDWKELYLTLFRSSEQAIQLLIQAQQACEEAVLAAGDGRSPQKSKRGCNIQPLFFCLTEPGA